MQIQSKNGPNRLTTIRHPFQAKDREPMAHLREAAAPAKGHLGPEIREVFDQMMEMTPDAPGVIYEETSVGKIPGWWCRPVEALEGAAILYLHGGAYVLGSARAARHLAGQLAVRANVAAFVAEYRLSTETIRQVLHEYGYSYQQNRTWCHTGYALRQRKSGTVRVYDPQTPEKKRWIEQAYEQAEAAGLVQ